jgi:TrmH family RNA methyltransferase
VYGTFLDGTSLYQTALTPTGVIVMGNEGRGISDEVAATVSRRLLIPTYPADAVSAESLNVATAAAITIAEFRRQSLSTNNG